MTAVPIGRIRRDFSQIKDVLDLPQLIEVQQKSFREFLQSGSSSEERLNIGLQGVFKSVFPIRGFTQSASLEFVGYHLDPPKYSEAECRTRSMTYAAPMRVLVRLVVWDVDEETHAQTIRDVKEQEVYFGEIPLMTKFGTFIINGIERVIVSQLHRSPGVFFEHDKGKTHSSGKLLYSARVIPYRGAWLDFEFDAKDLMYVRIDRRRKMPATILLRALGYSAEDILNMYYYKEKVFIRSKTKLSKSVVPEVLTYQRAVKDIKDDNGETIVKKDRKFTKSVLEKIKKAKLKEISTTAEEIVGKIAAEDVIDNDTGEVILEANHVLTEEIFDRLVEGKISEISLLYIDDLNVGPYVRNTLLTDKVNSPEEAKLEIYRRLRPGDPSTPESVDALFENLFFNPERYDLSKVGRLKVNYKFGINVPLEVGTLRKEDIIETVRYLAKLKDGEGEIDDIDHLGNRRVRSVGELLENQYRVGLVRMERAIRERMSLQDVETLMPHDLINSKPVQAAIKEFFGSSQLSQFLDQTNPLAEVTHKRRLSALGPGGLTRERAGFEVRDVHPTHYGRICPVETPEGPNIGLIASLSICARVNEFGFVETPYRKVENGKVTEQVVYCSALEEGDNLIAQATAPVDKSGRFTEEKVQCRLHGEFVLGNPKEVTLMDVSPQQLVSVAASLIPFLEHDDANRALMGSNMQRQAVPLLRTRAPIVGTGVEAIVARDSGVTVVAGHNGQVTEVDANRIVVQLDKSERKGDDSSVDVYDLTKFQRSNQGTCINQKPIVKKGDRIKRADVIADGQATDRGELALGQNVLVAFMPWGGYNFEDSILISERLVKDDVFTSLHIEEFECTARDTKLGKEDITRDIPNVGENALGNLDAEGIIRVGAEINKDDILVGKVTPKGETQLSPEERLLRAIFGDKAGDVKDTSLRVPPGIEGIVIHTQVFCREGSPDALEVEPEADEKSKGKVQKQMESELKAIRETVGKKIQKLLAGKVTTAKLTDDSGEKTLLAKGKKITEDALNKIPYKKWKEIEIEATEEFEEELEEMFEYASDQEDIVRMKYDKRFTRMSKGDELPPGVIKLVKVFVATKRKLAVGDKMAGRHGNKGVISRVLPEEDLPYTADGTPVDIVLNPLGVPSRMNVGQILETHLGWGSAIFGEKIKKILAAGGDKDEIVKTLTKAYGGSEEIKNLVDKASQKDLREYADRVSVGIPTTTPVFDGAEESDIKKMLKDSGLPESGQTILYDGRSGEAFDSPVTIGMMYMMKLHHLVDEKIHARSIGPYSLVTQQPLGGKAQFGGQRLGEMEVWAMEAYGAAYALQEFLTVKSDDVAGRTRMYESLVKGEKGIEIGLPESFKVLMKELQALCLDVDLLEHQ